MALGDVDPEEDPDVKNQVIDSLARTQKKKIIFGF
jgi:hypothetical protein